MLESQVTAIRKAMGLFEVPEREARTTENERRLRANQAMGRLASELASDADRNTRKCRFQQGKNWRSGRNHRSRTSY